MNEKAVKPTMADIKNAAGPKVATMVQFDGMRQVPGERDLFIIDGLEWNLPVEVDSIRNALMANGLEEYEADREVDHLLERLQTLKLAKLLGKRMRVMGPA